MGVRPRKGQLLRLLRPQSTQVSRSQTCNQRKAKLRRSVQEVARPKEYWPDESCHPDPANIAQPQAAPVRALHRATLLFRAAACHPLETRRAVATVLVAPTSAQPCPTSDPDGHGPPCEPCSR